MTIPKPLLIMQIICKIIIKMLKNTNLGKKRKVLIGFDDMILI